MDEGMMKSKILEDDPIDDEEFEGGEDEDVKEIVKEMVHNLFD